MLWQLAVGIEVGGNTKLLKLHQQAIGKVGLKITNGYELVEAAISVAT